MSDKYFQEAQRKILTVSEGDFIAKGMVDIARKIYEEAQALKPVDERLSDDPLTALAAFMDHHDIVIESASGVSIWSNKPTLNAMVFDRDGSTLTADDINA